MKLFKNRKAAGKLLADRLKDIKADLVLGIPRGGVVVAVEIAKKLNLPLDIVVTRKISAPAQEELALGAVNPDGEVIWDKSLLKEFELETKDLKLKIQEAWKELKRREDLYRSGEKPLDINGKTVILADDGIATGATVFSAVKYLKSHKAKVILAVPVCSKEALERIKNECKKVVILEIPLFFQAVGQFYYYFEPVSDEEVIQLLGYGG